MTVRAYRLERTQFLPQPRARVFAFFAEAGNLEQITPPFLHFRILTPPPLRIQAGTLIDYRLRLFGIPVSWRTRIEVFEPPVRFTDLQLAGPYRRWHHLHEFSAVSGGTLMRDIVDYELPLGPLGAIARALFVGRTLERIFDYRGESVTKIFAPDH
jgi:ligand-binding SRPBCC domain-containing protein